jgi:predicted TIM-barrel fold metal-dependent hydrolase
MEQGISRLRRRAFLGGALGTAAAAAMPKAVLAHVMSKFQLYDTHAHFYTDDVERYPIDGSTARYGAEEVTARIKASPKTPEVIFSHWYDANVEKGAAVQYGSAYLYDNRYIIDISRQHPDKITPIVILDDRNPDTPATIERMATQDNISGIRFRGFADEGQVVQYFLSDQAAEIWQAVDRLGLAMVLMPHSRAIDDRQTVLSRVGELAARYPNAAVILDHMGFPRPQAGAENFGFFPAHLELAKLPNVYYKYTNLLIGQLKEGSVPLAPFVEFSANTFGADKMIWGSDYGNTPGRMVDLVYEALESAERLSLVQQKAMFFNTADRIHVPGGRARTD